MKAGKVSTIVPSIPDYEEIVVEAVGAMARYTGDPSREPK